MRITAIGTVANSLPENGVILLTLLISKRYIPYTDLRKYFVWQMISCQFFDMMTAILYAHILHETHTYHTSTIPRNETMLLFRNAGYRDI